MLLSSSFDPFADAEKHPSLWIVGAGGLGREVAAWADRSSALVACATDSVEAPADLRLAHVDDDERLIGTEIHGVPVDGTLSDLAEAKGGRYAVAIGTSQTRRRIVDMLRSSAVAPTRIIHPDVSVHDSVEIGDGTILCPGATVTVDIRIGRHVIVNFHATVGHDAVLHDFVTLHPGSHVSGAVVVEEGAEIGAGAVLLPGVTVAAAARVGAGAVVTSDVASGTTVVGTPARPLSR